MDREPQRMRFLGERGVKTVVNEEVTVYRVIPSADGGYSLSAEYNGSVEITQYDNAGNPTMRTYGRIEKKQHGRYKIQICPIKEMYLIAQYVNLDNAAVIMCSSYPIDKEKVSKIKNKLLLEFDDITNKNAFSAFNIDKAMIIKGFIDSLEQNIKALYICCDSGESRSTAIGAAVMRYTKMSDMDMWKNPYYHPNPLVYQLQRKSFGISVSKFEVRRKVHINEKALRNCMRKK